MHGEVGERIALVRQIARREATLVKTELAQVTGHLRLASPIGPIASLLGNVTDQIWRTLVQRPSDQLPAFLAVFAFVFVVAPLVKMRVSSCHHHRATGGTDNRSPSRLHPTAFGGHLIKNGSFGLELRVASVALGRLTPHRRTLQRHFASANVISVDKNDVWFLGRYRKRRDRGSDDRKDRRNDFHFSLVDGVSFFSTGAK